MTDRFASLKSSDNTFKRDTFKKREPKNERFNNLDGNMQIGNDNKPYRPSGRFESLESEPPRNRFAYKKNTNKKFYRNRDNSNNGVSQNMGKFTQVGTGEVYFTPQHKCGSVNKDKKEKDKKKKDNIAKKDELDKEQNTADDIALTLAMAEQYQYYTESEDEDGEVINEEEVLEG